MGSWTNRAGLTEAMAALRLEAAAMRSSIEALTDGVAQLQRRTEAALARRQSDLEQTLVLAGVPYDSLRGKGILIDGSPSRRVRIRRLTQGDPVAQPFSRAMGVSRCVTDAADVRTLWERLLQLEAECGTDVLEGLPVTILSIPGGAVAKEARTLRVSVRDVDVPDEGPTVCVARFTYAFAPQKLRNFGHWLLDCVPHVAALAALAPGATFLLPESLKGFQRETLALAGLEDTQMMRWDGTPVSAARLLILSNDGRIGGGRPLSALLLFRRMLAPPSASARPAWRRIYVSRRDARSKRQWLTNEAAVEGVFRERGFEILLMETCSLDRQIQLFREAAVVAGPSGAGLTDLLFAPAGTHVMVLVTDSLVRWYGEEAGARSLWTTSARARPGHLTALGDSPRFYAHLAAAFGQVCHSFVSGDEVPLADLARFVDDALQRMEPRQS